MRANDPTTRFSTETRIDSQASTSPRPYYPHSMHCLGGGLRVGFDSRDVSKLVNVDALVERYMAECLPVLCQSVVGDEDELGEDEVVWGLYC